MAATATGNIQSTQGESSDKMDSRNKEVKKEIQELKVLEGELRSLKTGAKVYKLQPNSNIFFRTKRDTIAAETKIRLNKLVNKS